MKERKVSILEEKLNVKLNEFLNYLMNDMLFHVYKNTKSWPVISDKFNTMFRKSCRSNLSRQEGIMIFMKSINIIKTYISEHATEGY